MNNKEDNKENNKHITKHITLKKEKHYWLNKLSGHSEPTRIPYGYKKQSGENGERDTVTHLFSQELSNRLFQMSKGSDPMLYMILAAGVTLLLHKYTAATDIIIGAPIYKQQNDAQFINTILALRNNIQKDMTFKQLLMQVRQTIIEAVDNQNFPLDTLPLEFKRPVSASQFPLFDVTLLLEEIHHPKYIRHIPTNLNFSFRRKKTSDVNVSDVNEKVEVDLEYNALYYDPFVAEQLLQHLQSLMEQAVFAVDTPLEHHTLLSEEETHRLVHQLNDTAVDFPLDKPLHQLFEEQAHKTPDRIAVTARQLLGDQDLHSLTYRELNLKAHRLACTLSQKGVKPDTIVAISLPPSQETIIGILGILKAGGAYLPLDASYPKNRIDALLRDSRCKIIVTVRAMAPFISTDAETIYMDDIIHSPTTDKETGPHQDPGPENLAYVIYTSGSTGTPKGVAVPHRAIVNYACWRVKAHQYTETDASLQLISLSFDGFSSNVFPLLISGGKTVLPSQNKWRDVDYLRHLIKDQQITNFSIVPSMYRMILDGAETADFSGLRFVVLAGEKAHPQTVAISRQLFPLLQLINEYGPTENAVAATSYFNLTPDTTTIIGTPIANNGIMILAPSGTLMPLGIPGELCLFGKSLANGYLHNPQLTSEKFSGIFSPHQSYQSHLSHLSYQSHPSYPSHYRTGDLARRLPDGTVEILGRIDYQEQIRGFRVEPGEIETILQAQDTIAEAAVVAKTITDNTGTDRQHTYNILCAYIVPTTSGTFTEAAAIQSLRETLQETLPDYMVPTYILEIQSIPRLVTGKTDRRTLKEMLLDTHTTTEYIAPRTETEKKLAALWEDFLGKEKIGIKDNFFNIGGDSIKSIGLLSQINKEFNVKFELVDLYENETIEQSAHKIDNQTQSPTTTEATTDSEYQQVLNEFADIKKQILKK